MRRRKRTAALTGLAAACAVAIVVVSSGSAWSFDGPQFTNVATANTKSTGYAPASKLSVELRQVVVAQGSTKMENSSALTSYYGYDNDVLNSAGQPQMVPTPPNTSVEATKTEPDKNAYLVFKHSLPGADPNFYYGTHFLFQGHEGGAGGFSYITRINLDADAAHRVTLLATKDSGGANLSTIDGVTWDPWAKRLLFTTEEADVTGVYQATPGYPSTVDDLSGSFGDVADEGIQNDSDGNLWISEDASGPTKGSTTAKVPNSFIYRFVPKHPDNLKRGKLQVLQVLNGQGNPITKASQTPLNSPDQLALHTYGNVFNTKWITIHDTAVDGTTPFDANALATAANGTPFKRPENAQFRPGVGFREYFFDETGDTNATSPENDSAGGWDSVFKLTQNSPSSNSGKLTIFYKGDEVHAGFDNVTFLSKNLVTFVEDAGDTLHAQRNALDSGYILDVTKDYSNPANQPVRWLAEGRDASATLDSANDGFGVNEGDNEITGVHVSNGDPSIGGILGAQVPKLFHDFWRWFYTQQHGDNPTYEVIPAN